VILKVIAVRAGNLDRSSLGDWLASILRQTFLAVTCCGRTATNAERTGDESENRPSRDQRRPVRCSQVRMAKIPNTEAIAITLQKICNGFPLILKILTERYGLFSSPSNWRHTTTRLKPYSASVQNPPASMRHHPFPTPKGSCDLEARAPVFFEQDAQFWSPDPCRGRFYPNEPARRPRCLLFSRYCGRSSQEPLYGCARGRFAAELAHEQGLDTDHQDGAPHLHPHREAEREEPVRPVVIRVCLTAKGLWPGSSRESPAHSRRSSLSSA